MKVAIIGGCPSTQYLAPFDNLEWEIWVHGNQYDRHQNRRVTRIFEIHDDLSEHSPEYPKWLIDKQIPLVVSKKFPIKEEHVQYFPEESNVLEKLTSTPAYMMAMAIYEGATHIGIYGVDMGVDDHEYFKQRSAMYAWIGYAKGLGIDVYIPKESSLFKDQYEEGRDWGKGTTGPFTERSFSQMIQLHQAKINEYNQLIHTHNGCMQAYKRLSQIARAVESGQDINNLIDSTVAK